MRLQLAIFCSIILLFSGCLKQIPYEQSQLESFSQRAENLRLDHKTAKGHQVAFYLPPLQNPQDPPKRIAILYPGISAVALGWLPFINLAESPNTAYLLIDYPGRGFCEGSMHPEKNYLNTEGALKALAAHFHLEQIDAELSLMGHSFGTGAALHFAVRRPVKRIVLVAPFNTLKKAVAVKSYILSLLMPAQIDSRQLIRTLLDAESPPEITILHGSRDSTLPVTMGRDLAAVATDKIRFSEFPEDGHANILSRRRDLIFQTLNGIAE